MPDKQLDGVIRFWEYKIQFDRYLMDPGTESLIQLTIKYLKELKEAKDA